MTHAELVKRAARWLKNTKHCMVVATDCWNMGIEIPDVMGWTTGWSILVECKTSRGDFRRDLKKHSRYRPDSGPGNLRFYMTPPGLLKPCELPDRWGLLEARDKQVRVIKDAKSRDDYLWIAMKERPILVSVLRRCQEGESDGT